jgi:hypothetical protein
MTRCAADQSVTIPSAAEGADLLKGSEYQVSIESRHRTTSTPVEKRSHASRAHADNIP